LFERRTLLKAGFGAAVGATLAGAPLLGWAEPLTAAAPTPATPRPVTATPGVSAPLAPVRPVVAQAAMRSVALDNLHTGESMEAVYWADGDYIPDVLAAVNVHLRDFRTGDVHPIDPRLLDLLDAVTLSTGATARFQVISGYRSAATNAMLRERSEEVAKKSFHMSGMAIDVRLPGVDLNRLHGAAVGQCRGGVGYYPESNFVHMDVGPVRCWQGA
jgi:uncharacterized protein YcbK (DUF882 family)